MTQTLAGADHLDAEVGEVAAADIGQLDALEVVPDALHSVNVRYTESFPSWPLEGNQSTLRETVFGGPVLGYVGTTRQVLVAWTGTDTAHHLNVAVVGV